MLVAWSLDRWEEAEDQYPVCKTRRSKRERSRLGEAGRWRVKTDPRTCGSVSRLVSCRDDRSLEETGSRARNIFPTFPLVLFVDECDGEDPVSCPLLPPARVNVAFLSRRWAKTDDQLSNPSTRGPAPAFV